MRLAALVLLAAAALVSWTGGAGALRAAAALAGVALVLAGVSVLWRGRSTAARWEAGAAGERATAAALAMLGDRWHVVADRRLPGRRWNLDHLVVGPAGVVVVESKRWMGTVRCGGRRLRVGPDDRSDALDQVRWQVEAVAGALDDVPVRGFLCVSGPRCVLRARWWRRRRGAALVGGVPVGTPDELVRWLRRLPRRLTRGEAAAIAGRVAGGFPPAS